jgi:hypothetical protein
MGNIKKFNEEWESRIDSDIIQEISDRLYGPDGEAYLNDIKELNKKYRKREGKVGSEFFDPEIINKRREREREIINRFK